MFPAYDFNRIVRVFSPCFAGLGFGLGCIFCIVFHIISKETKRTGWVLVRSTASFVSRFLTGSSMEVSSARVTLATAQFSMEVRMLD